MQLFSKTREKVDTLVNDRVVAPTRTALIISITAFIVAGLALIVAVNNANH
jgi:hypothetical protein